ncbi:hypothetical protein [Rhodococcus oryzae]|uniref:hypothetical protein n=1 Tax=Rhodococcus oryzae TaxID=2571143 RepID=UPI00378A10A8
MLVETCHKSAAGRSARSLLAALLAVPLAAAGLSVFAAPAAAVPAGPTASVSMGDSYMSGEAGRWKGNSLTTSGSRDGTDRAWTGSGYDPTRVYGSTSANGCDRSDSAEVNSAASVAQTRINLACSGAVTANIFRAANGGQAFKGEAPQADQLAAVAAANKVKLITLSIGGNDLGFADVISTCVQDYLVWYSYCNDDQQAAVDGKMNAAMDGVAKSIDEIRAVMSGAGYAAADYRVVLQSAPSPTPARRITGTRKAAGRGRTPAAARSGTATPTGPEIPWCRRFPTASPVSLPRRVCSSSTSAMPSTGMRSAPRRPSR